MPSPDPNPSADAWKPRFQAWRDGRAEGGRMPSTHPAIRNPAWSFRGYLPHFDQPGRVQSLSFRLGDAVPADVLAKWKSELGFLEKHAPPSDAKQTELRRRITVYEDAGHGECLLREPWAAQIVRDSLLHFDGERYKMLAWCIMPNHVHALIETVDGHAVKEVVGRWKSFTARFIHARLGRSGALWMEDFFDRFIRSARHLEVASRYIAENPVKAGLCQKPEDWMFGGNPGNAGVHARLDPEQPHTAGV